MIDHQKTHRRERAFRCPSCQQCFYTSVNLERHLSLGNCTENAAPSSQLAHPMQQPTN